MNDDERFMTRALELAAEPPFTSPNPRVGAVVVKAGRIVAEGVHRGSGTPHAETVALQDTDAAGATLYVNLEPCIHQGKMPPCAPALIDAGLTKVVVALQDPDARVSGGGIAMLREASIDVVEGVCLDRATALNRTYLHQRTTGRPFLTLKLALSLDGKIAARDGSSRWITSKETRRRVHERRVEVDGILIGAGTVIADDPRLTARDVAAPRQPVRVVCDAKGRMPATHQVFDAGEVIVMTTVECGHAQVTRWKEAGAEVVVVPPGEGGVDLAAVIENLGGRGWIEVYCEGGAQLATSLLREDLVDRLELNYGPVLIGGDGIGVDTLGVGTMDEALRWKTLGVKRLGDDIVTILERVR